MIEVRHGNATSATRWRESGTLDVLAHLLVQGDGLDPGVAAAPDAAIAALTDFAFFTEIAQAAENVVFLLILNSIRSVYLEHAELIPVTTDHQQLAPMCRAPGPSTAN